MHGSDIGERFLCLISQPSRRTIYQIRIRALAFYTFVRVSPMCVQDYRNAHQPTSLRQSKKAVSYLRIGDVVVGCEANSVYFFH